MPTEPESVESLYEAHASGLLAFLAARLRNTAWAEDLLHDTFLAYMRQAGREIAAPKAYLYQTAHRLSLNALRDRGRNGRAHQALVADRQEWKALDSADHLLAVEVRQTLTALPDEEREVLVLRVYGSLTFQEISELVGATLSTVFRRYQRAIATVKQVFNDAALRS
jgi:RNA polymerase sigma-70 factor (ECF subfamily)